MSVIYELSEKHIEQLHTLFQSEWWTKGRTLSETRRCVSGSQICIGIIDGKNDLIAFARVITDFTFKALIFDVIVSSKSRKNGLGLKLIETIKKHPKINTVKNFELYCLPELVPFYESLGFSSDVGGINLVRCVNA